MPGINELETVTVDVELLALTAPDLVGGLLPVGLPRGNDLVGVVMRDDVRVRREVLGKTAVVQMFV